MAIFSKKRLRFLAMCLVLLIGVVQFIPMRQAYAADPVTGAYTVSPSSWKASELPKTVFITSSQSDTFHNGVQVYLKKGTAEGIAQATEYISGTEIKFTAASGLAAGTYDILINDVGSTTTNKQYVTGKTFTVGDPSVSTSPASVAKNYSSEVTVTVTGTNTNFSQGQTKVEIYQGATLKEYVNGTPSVSSPTSLNFVLKTLLASGTYDLKFTTTFDDKNEVFTQTGALVVRDTPSLALNTTLLAEGYSSTNITVTGTNTGFNNQTVVKVIDGAGNDTAKAGTPTVNTAASLTFSVNTGLAAGSYNVQVQTGDEVAQTTLTVGAVSAVLKNGTNVFTGMPKWYTSTYSLILEGTNTSFSQGTTSVKLYSGETEVDAKISSVQVNSTTNVSFTLEKGLDSGTYTVKGTTGSQIVSANFTVSVPSISSVTIGSEVAAATTLPKGYQDSTVTVVGTNTLFTSSTTIGVYQGAAEQLNKVESKNVTSLTNMTFTLKSGLAAGDYTILIDMDGSTGTADQFSTTLTITNPTFSTNMASVVNTDTTPREIVVTGTNTNFSKATPAVTIKKDGTETSVGTISSVTVTSDTSMKFSVTPSSLAASGTGTYTIVIRTTKSSVVDETVTQTGILTVNSGGISSVSPSLVYSDQLSGGVSLSVTGSNTSFGDTTTVAIAGNTTTITPTVNSATSLSFTVPTDLTPGTYTININDGAAYQATFQVQTRSISVNTDSKAYGYSAFNMTVTGDGVTFDTTTNRPTVKIIDNWGTQVAGTNIVLQDANISSSQFIFAFPTGLTGGTYKVQVTWAGGSQATLTLTDTISIVQTAPALTDVTVADASGDANNGKVLVTDSRANKTNTLMYKVSASALTTPNVGDATTSFTAVPGDGLIALTAGQYISIISVTGSPSAVVTFKSFQVNPVDEVAPTLTNVTVGDASGYANNGKVLVTDNRTDKTTNRLMYKVTSSTVATPNVGATTDGYTLLPEGGGMVALTTSQYLSVVSVNGAQTSIVTFKLFQFTPVDESAAALTDVTVADASGWQNNNKVLVTDSRTDKTNSLMYKVTSTSVATPTMGSVTTGYTSMPADGLVSLTAGQYLSIVSVTGSPAAIVAFKIFEVTPVNDVAPGGTVQGYVKREAKPADGHGSIQVTVKENTAYTTTTSANGYFELSGVPAGTYTLVLSATNYLTREIANVTITESGTVVISTSGSMIDLWAGDFDGVNGINATDLSVVIASFGKTSGTTGYDVRADFDGASGVNATDLSVLIGHFGKVSTNYTAWTW